MTSTWRGKGLALVDTFGWEREGSASCGRPEEKLEPTDVILSSRAKTSAFLVPKFPLCLE